MSPIPPHDPPTRLDLSHLRRDARTALELAIVELAPNDLLDALAWSSGMLESLIELPPESAPALALAPAVAKRARAAIEKWCDWTSHRKRLA